MFRGFQLLLSGVPQQLSDVYGDGTSVVVSAHDLAYRMLVFEGHPSNNADIYIGDSSALTSSNAGIHLPKIANVNPQRFPLGPFEAGPMKLSNFWVLGTAGDHLHIAGVPF